MAATKTIKTAIEKQPIEDTSEFIEVALCDNFKKHTGVIIKGKIINFIKGKAKVHKETADKLRVAGFIK